MPECFLATTDPTGAKHDVNLQLAAGGNEFTRSVRSIQSGETYYCAPCRRGRRGMIVPRTPGYQALHGKPLPTSKDVWDEDD